jgi:neutral ceramidase
MASRHFHSAIAATCAVAALSLSACTGSSSPVNGSTAQGSLPPKAMCILKSPYLAIGSSPTLSVDGITYTTTHQPDAPSPLELPLAKPGPQPAGACHGSSAYRFGSGLYDTAGPIGGDPTGHADFFGEVLPPQVPNGIHTRPFARAYAIESPCNGKRVAFVSIDLMGMSALIHQEVLKRVAADPVLRQYYGIDNLMLSGTHSHEVGGGFGLVVLPDLSSDLPGALNDIYVYIQTLLISNPDYDDDNFNAIVGGIVQALRRAHANLEAHQDSSSIKLAIGQLLNANVNRDPLGYEQDSPSERAGFLDQNGHEVNVDKRFLQLNFVRGNGSAVGALNWFGVHPTSMGNHDLLLSSDNKGYASLGFEKLMGTRYAPDANGAADGKDNFVAAFAQTDEGDTVPDLFVFDRDVSGGNGPGQGVPYQFRGGTDDPYGFDQPGYEQGEPKFTAVSGTKQLAQALTEFTQGSALSGPVDYRFFYADLSADAITDPTVLAGLSYADEPADLYTPAKTTCTSGYGISQFAGGANAPDFGAAGYACGSDAPVPSYFSDARKGYNGIYNGTGYLAVEKNDQVITVPFDGVAVYTAVTPLLCAAAKLRPGDGCQAEKPVSIGASTNPVPVQIFRLGNLAVLGVPLEVTTMSARRLRKTVLDALSPVGVDTVVIAGLSNDYHEYMATREEYTAQMYEGASTIFGPWQLAAIQQEARKLALTLATGQPAPQGLAAAVLPTGPKSPVTVDPQSDFGSIVTDAKATYTQGDTVDVSFVSGYPGNDLKTMASYLYAEKQNSKGGWDAVATNGLDPQLTFIWHAHASLINTELARAGPSTVESLWQIPHDAPAGTYRIRHEGVYRLSADQAPTPYEGISSSFQITGTPGDCP